jgi:hypothetical protein
MIENSINAHAIDSTHHGILYASVSTELLRINQCTITMIVTMTETLMMDMLVSIGSPPCVIPNMEPSMVQDCLKVDALKKTQVTLIRKKVSNA